MHDLQATTQTHPVEVGVLETLRFVERFLTETDMRILEVGCGDGRLAVRLAERGATVRGIDADPERIEEARERGVDAEPSELEAFTDAPYDLVLFSRSLHHMVSVESSVKKALDLLKPDGKLLVEDFGVDLVDSQGVNWRYAVEVFLSGLGLVTGLPEPAGIPSDAMARWRREHDQGHSVAGSDRLRTVLHAACVVDAEERAPYLYRYMLPYLDHGQRGYEMGEHLLEWENGLIAGGMSAVGLRWVGRH